MQRPTSTLRPLAEIQSEKPMREERSNLRSAVASVAKRHPRGKGLCERMPQRELTDAILRQAPVGLVVCDKRGVVTLSNNAAGRLAQRDPTGRRRTLTPAMWGVLVDLDGTRTPLSEWPVRRAVRGETISDKECHSLKQVIVSSHLDQRKADHH
jgi:hypothetical protein